MTIFDLNVMTLLVIGIGILIYMAGMAGGRKGAEKRITKMLRKFQEEYIENERLKLKNDRFDLTERLEALEEILEALDGTLDDVDTEIAGVAESLECEVAARANSIAKIVADSIQGRMAESELRIISEVKQTEERHKAREQKRESRARQKAKKAKEAEAWDAITALGDEANGGADAEAELSEVQ